MGKMLESVIYNRLLPFVELTGGPLENQCGFRKARPTADVIEMFVDQARATSTISKCCSGMHLTRPTRVELKVSPAT